MKNLRAVQSRVNTVETDNDLRGLDDESLLKAIDPRVGLIVEGEKRFVDDALKSMTVHTSLNVQRQNTNRMIVTYAQPLSFKEQIVELFVCGLSLAPSRSTSSPLIFGLMVLDVFQDKMKGARDNKTSQLEFTDVKIDEFMQKDTFFKISQVATPTLRQAGFNIEAQKGDSKLDRKTILEIMPAKEQTQSAKKVM